MATKTPESGGTAVMATELSRDLTLFHVTMMGVGMMIGAGVFLGIGKSLTVVGPGGTVLTFALNGVVAICSAMSYAELSSAIPRAGGAYNFARIGFGRGPSFLAGWMEWFASSVAGSMYALTCAIFVLNFFAKAELLPWNHTPDHTSVKVAALLLAGFFVYINYRGASETGRAGALFTLGQTITLVAVAAAGLLVAIRFPARLQNFQPFLTNRWSALIATMGFTYVAFEGFEVIAQAGDETIEPRRNLPKAMLLSVVIAVFTYVAVSFASIVAIKAPGEWGMEPKVFFDISVSALLPLGSLVVVLAVVFSATSALNATTYSATRAVYALGRDRFLPGILSRISVRRKTPYMALLVTALIVIATALFLPTEDVMASASIMFLFLFLLVNLCAIKMRRQMGDELQYGYVMPLFPLPPLLAIIAQVLLAVHLRELSMTAWIIAPCWLAGGGLIYYFYGRSHVLQTRDEILTIEEQQPLGAKPCHILVPVANPDNALKTVMTTVHIAAAKDAQVELLHMVEIPEQIPLSDAEKYTDPGREAIAEAMIYLAARFPFSHAVRYCRNTARGILSAARDHQADLIILGWRGHTLRHDFLFGSTVDPVLERNPCDVVVLKNVVERTYKRILVPFAGGPHSTLAVQIASTLVDQQEGEVIPFNVAVPGRATADIEAALAKAAEPIHCPRELVKPQYAVSKHVVEAIIEAAADCDLIVVGATGEQRWRQFTASSVPDALASRTDKPLIMVKAKTPVKSWLNRWL